jgi:Transposase DDE domain group 1
LRARNAAISDESLLPFDRPTIARKRVSAACDGGQITSDGGVMLLGQAELRLGITDRLAAVIPDGRDAICFPIFCASASSLTPAAMKTPTILIGYGSIRRSSWPVAGYPTLAAIYAHSRPYRGGRMLRHCATSSA